MQDPKVKVIIDFYRKSNKTNYWKTLSEVVAATNLQESEILQILNSSENFYKAKRISPNKDMYTTKELFRKYQSFGSKILGAFKNRIQ